MFNLDDTCDYPIVHEDVINEYWRMDTNHKGWRLPLHRPGKDGNLVTLVDDDGPPFHVDLFEPYIKYTYYLAGQLVGTKAPKFMYIVPMVIAADVQCHSTLR